MIISIIIPNFASKQKGEEIMDATLKRKNIDLPTDVLAKLSAMAMASGRTLKNYMESILVNKATETPNPSPSNDPWFDNPDNIRMVKHGIQQLENGEGKVYSASELKSRLGL